MTATIGNRAGIVRRLVAFILARRRRRPVDSITKTCERIDAMEERVERIEAVTMTWTMDDLTPEQRAELGVGSVDEGAP